MIFGNLFMQRPATFLWTLLIISVKQSM